MPRRFRTVTGHGRDAFAQINRNFQMIDGEGITKTFNGPNRNHSIVQGRLPNGKYGQIYYDDDGTARILIGQAPDDGRMGVWVSQPGQDVLDLLEP